MSALTADELQAIRTRAEAATPGPWVRASTSNDRFSADKRPVVWVDTEAEVADGEDCIAEMQDTPRRWQDAGFVAHARTDVPALLDHIASLESQLASAQAEIATARRILDSADDESLVERATTICPINTLARRTDRQIRSRSTARTFGVSPSGTAGTTTPTGAPSDLR